MAQHKPKRQQKPAQNIYDYGVKGFQEISEALLTKTPKSEEIIDELLQTDKNLSTKTRLSDIDIVTLTRADVLAEIFNLPTLKLQSQRYKEHLISQQGKGRLEIVQALTAQIIQERVDATIQAQQGAHR